MTKPTNAEILEIHESERKWANGYCGGGSGEIAHIHRRILLDRLEAAEQLNDDQGHRLGKAEAKIKQIEELPCYFSWYWGDKKCTCATQISRKPCPACLLNSSEEQDND